MFVSTYNQPRHLERCLFALGRQSGTPFEVLVADDGSEEPTREVVASFISRHSGRVAHLWQEDLGFRKTRILNKAILATDANYLVFMDVVSGDCFGFQYSI